MITMMFKHNNCYKAGLPYANGGVPVGIFVHDTGAINPKLSRYCPNDSKGKIGVNPYGNHYDTARPDGRDMCPSAWCGLLADGVTVEVVECLPHKYKSWCQSEPANSYYMSIEICAGDNIEYIKEAFETVAQYVATLCKKYDWGAFDMVNVVGTRAYRILSHKEGDRNGLCLPKSGKVDADNMFAKAGLTMDDLRKRVDTIVRGDDIVAPELPFVVRLPVGTHVYIDAAKTRVRMDIPINTLYTIVEMSGCMGKLKSGAGWIDCTPYMVPVCKSDAEKNVKAKK